MCAQVRDDVVVNVPTYACWAPGAWTHGAGAAAGGEAGEPPHDRRLRAAGGGPDGDEEATGGSLAGDDDRPAARAPPRVLKEGDRPPAADHPTLKCLRPVASIVCLHDAPAPPLVVNVPSPGNDAGVSWASVSPQGSDGDVVVAEGQRLWLRSGCACIVAGEWSSVDAGLWALQRLVHVGSTASVGGDNGGRRIVRRLSASGGQVCLCTHDAAEQRRPNAAPPRHWVNATAGPPPVPFQHLTLHLSPPAAAGQWPGDVHVIAPAAQRAADTHSPSRVAAWHAATWAADSRAVARQRSDLQLLQGGGGMTQGTALFATAAVSLAVGLVVGRWGWRGRVAAAQSSMLSQPSLVSRAPGPHVTVPAPSRVTNGAVVRGATPLATDALAAVAAALSHAPG
jgi:hypothetical protein